MYNWFITIFLQTFFKKKDSSSSMKRVPFCLFLLMQMLLIVSCKQQYRINGKIEVYGFEGQKLNLIVYSNGEFNVVDSCVVYHGTFNMQGGVDDVSFALLCKGREPILPLYLEKGVIDVLLTPTQFVVRGTEQNNLMYSFLDSKRQVDNRYEEMIQKKISMIASVPQQDSELRIIEDSIEAICREMEELMFQFISDNYDKKVAVGVFSMLCTSTECPQITPLIKRVLDNATKDFMQAPYVKRFISEVGYSRN